MRRIALTTVVRNAPVAPVCRLPRRTVSRFSGRIRSPRKRNNARHEPFTSAPVGREAIDVVDIFRRSEFVPDIVEAAIRKGAKVIWMQEDAIHEDAARRAREAGLDVG
jgi:hypothetical protein